MNLFSKAAKIHSSNESLITAEKMLPKSELNLEDDKSKKSVMISKASDKAENADSVLPFWVVHLPNTFALLWVITFIVIPFLWIRCNGIERPIVTNPCDPTDLKAYRTFVELWKEKNRTKINYKIFVEQNDDMPLGTKENDAQQIQAATNKIWSQTLMDNPDYRRYEKCFSDNNQSKLSYITYICVANYVIFNICFISCYFYAELYSTQLIARKTFDETIAYNSFKAKDTAFKCSLIYPPAHLIMNIMLYRMLSENTVSTDFLL